MIMGNNRTFKNTSALKNEVSFAIEDSELTSRK
jgi:hypothetical protein